MPDESTAYHEAGHAVAAAVVGIPIRWVDLGELRTAEPGRDPDELRRRLVVRVSGTIAQDLFRGETDPTVRTREFCLGLLGGTKVRREVWGEDFGVATHHALDASGRDADAARDCLLAPIDEALALLRQRWHTVREIAAAIWSGQTLTGEDVASVVRRCDAG